MKFTMWNTHHLQGKCTKQGMKFERQQQKTNDHSRTNKSANHKKRGIKWHAGEKYMSQQKTNLDN